MEETITRKKGWHHSKEWKQRMSERMSGKNNPAWKGDAVGRVALHEFVGNRKPKPNMCESCHETTPRDLHNTPGTYKRNLEDWVWLCRRCHMIEDERLEEMVKRNKDGLGKPLSEEHKQKVSDSIKSGYDSGKIINPMKGKHHTEETKRKISESLKETWSLGRRI
jgi:hypothetical protein